MTTAGLTYRAAAPSDIDILLRLMHGFQQDDPWSVPFREEEVRQSLRELLASPSAGRAFLICKDGLCIGYLVLSFDFSMEYGGKNAWIDELFVQREFRGQGVGSRAMDFAVATRARTRSEGSASGSEPRESRDRSVPPARLRRPGPLPVVEVAFRKLEIGN